MPDALPADLADALRAAGARRRPFGDPALLLSRDDVDQRRRRRRTPSGERPRARRSLRPRRRRVAAGSDEPGARRPAPVCTCRRSFVTPRGAPFLTLAGGVAVAEGIRAATGLPLEIKWPNDVVTRGTSGLSRRRKLAGVLAEAFVVEPTDCSTSSWASASTSARRRTRRSSRIGRRRSRPSWAARSSRVSSWPRCWRRWPPSSTPIARGDASGAPGALASPGAVGDWRGRRMRHAARARERHRGGHRRRWGAARQGGESSGARHRG